MASPTQWTCVWASSRRWEGQGSLACCSTCGHKESDTQERQIINLPSFLIRTIATKQKQIINQLLCPRDSPEKNTRVRSHFPLRGIFPTQGSILGLLHWLSELPGKPNKPADKLIIILLKPMSYILWSFGTITWSNVLFKDIGANIMWN